MIQINVFKINSKKINLITLFFDIFKLISHNTNKINSNSKLIKI
jgi:hypothetical protein